MNFLRRVRRQLIIRRTNDWSLVPGGRQSGVPVTRTVLIAARHLPTIDYYLGARPGSDPLSSEPPPRLLQDEDPDDPSVAGALLEGTRVVLVRMPSRRWAATLEAARQRLAEIVWLIDDDIWAAREDPWLPSDYRARLLTEYLEFREGFSHLIDHVWASTPAIAARFPPDRVTLRPPAPIEPRRIPRRPLTLFYHGTAAHQREHAFLVPILQRVQTRLNDTVVEVCGDHALYKAYRGIPRLRVLHPMPWPDYLWHLHAGHYDLGLVPLLDTPFNRGRSGVKALELQAIGARGLLSHRPPYTDYAHLPGLQLVGDSPDEWVEAIECAVQNLRQCRPEPMRG